MALRGGLHEETVVLTKIGRAEQCFAKAVADADHGRDVLLNRVGERVEDVVIDAVADVNEEDAGVGRDPGGIFQVQFAFRLTAGDGGLHTRAGHQNRGDGGVAVGLELEWRDGIARVDVGLADDGEAGTGSGSHNYRQGAQVVDCRGIPGSEVMCPARWDRVGRVSGRVDSGPGMQVRQVQHRRGERNQGRGQLQVGGGSEVGFAVQKKAVELCAERGIHLGRAAGEGDAVMTGGNAIHGKALGGEPGPGSGEVGLGHAEARGKGGRREPVVIERRLAIALGGQQGVQVRRLRGGALEDEGDARNCRARGQGTEVLSGVGQGAAGAGKRLSLGPAQAFVKARIGGLGGGEERTRKKQRDGKGAQNRTKLEHRDRRLFSEGL